MVIFNIISGICSILGLVVSLIVANKVRILVNKIQFTDKSSHVIKQSGRDNIQSVGTR